MGHIASKIFRTEIPSKEGSKKEASTQTTENEKDSELLKTPVMMKKSDFSSEMVKCDDSSPLKVKLLKNLKLDPRSPTVGIYRTPIIVEDVDSNKLKSNYLDSPISIYSSYERSSEDLEIMTPSEPSVNVSGFEKANEMINDFIVPMENVENKSSTNKVTNIKVANEPSTHEMKELLREINSKNENYAKNKQVSLKKENKINNSDGKHINDCKLNILKTRTPLSNISGSANSPNSAVQSAKIYSRSKALVEFGTENSVSPKVQQSAQWDVNNTVII